MITMICVLIFFCRSLSLYFQFKKPFKFVSQSINIGVISSRFVHHRCVWAQMSKRDSMLCNLIADSNYTSTFIASYEIQLACARHVFENGHVCEDSNELYIAVAVHSLAKEKERQTDVRALCTHIRTNREDAEVYWFDLVITWILRLFLGLVSHSSQLRWTIFIFSIDCLRSKQKSTNK